MVWVGEDGMSFVWDCVACCIGGPGVENAGAMKQIRNAELVDSGTQDSYQATHNR